jgi:hypothetical protein
MRPLKIAVDVPAHQLRHRLTAVDVAARYRTAEIVVICSARQLQPGLIATVGLKALRPLHDVPAVVAPGDNVIDLFPLTLPDVAGPHLTCLTIEAEPPGIAEAVSVYLGFRVETVKKGIVERDTVPVA